MTALGLGALTHAMRLSLYHDPYYGYWSELSVLNAAHAAEILIKARIAMEHPLLIFEVIPKSSSVGGPLLTFEDLLDRGRTVDFQNLPERLWATTGQRLCEQEVYTEFGRLRNTIQHFAVPDIDVSQRTLQFVFEVLDPFILENWGLYSIDFNEEYGDHYEHIFESLVSRDLRPRISPDAARCWRDLGYSPAADSPSGYKDWFEREMSRALSEPDAQDERLDKPRFGP